MISNFTPPSLLVLCGHIGYSLVYFLGLVLTVIILAFITNSRVYSLIIIKFISVIMNYCYSGDIRFSLAMLFFSLWSIDKVGRNIALYMLLMYPMFRMILPPSFMSFLAVLTLVVSIVFVTLSGMRDLAISEKQFTAFVKANVEKQLEIKVDTKNGLLSMFSSFIGQKAMNHVLSNSDIFRVVNHGLFMAALLHDSSMLAFTIAGKCYYFPDAIEKVVREAELRRN